jgi:hypothetical protein
MADLRDIDFYNRLARRGLLGDLDDGPHFKNRRLNQKVVIEFRALG